MIHYATSQFALKHRGLLLSFVDDDKKSCWRLMYSTRARIHTLALGANSLEIQQAVQSLVFCGSLTKLAEGRSSLLSRTVPMNTDSRCLFRKLKFRDESSCENNITRVVRAESAVGYLSAFLARPSALLQAPNSSFIIRAIRLRIFSPSAPSKLQLQRFFEPLSTLG